jgi:hypothetical protein
VRPEGLGKFKKKELFTSSGPEPATCPITAHRSNQTQRWTYRTYANAGPFSKGQVRVRGPLFLVVVREALRVESVRVRIVERVSVNGVDGNNDWRPFLDEHIRPWDSVRLSAHSDQVRQRGIHPQGLCERKKRLLQLRCFCQATSNRIVSNTSSD